MERTKSYGDITVELTLERALDNYMYREFMLTHSEVSTCVCVHVPRASSLIELIVVYSLVFTTKFFLAPYDLKNIEQFMTCMHDMPVGQVLMWLVCILHYM